MHRAGEKPACKPGTVMRLGGRSDHCDNCQRSEHDLGTTHLNAIVGLIDRFAINRLDSRAKFP